MPAAREMLRTPARARQQQAARLAAEVRARLPGVAARFQEECGATEVWLFGSLAEGRFDLDSDCDLALAGCDAAGFGARTGAHRLAGRPLRPGVARSRLHGAGRMRARRNPTRLAG